MGRKSYHPLVDTASAFPVYRSAWFPNRFSTSYSMRPQLQEDQRVLPKSLAYYPYSEILAGHLTKNDQFFKSTQRRFRRFQYRLFHLRSFRARVRCWQIYWLYRHRRTSDRDIANAHRTSHRGCWMRKGRYWYIHNRLFCCRCWSKRVFQLVVIVISVVWKRLFIALENIIGFNISNILSAFSLGFLFHSITDVVEFDRNAKAYSLLLFLLSVFISILTFVEERTSIWIIFERILLAIFVLYVVSIA